MDGCFFGWVLKILKSPQRITWPSLRDAGCHGNTGSSSCLMLLEDFKEPELSYFNLFGAACCNLTCAESKRGNYCSLFVRRLVFFFTTFSEIVCLQDREKKPLNPDNKKKNNWHQYATHTLCACLALFCLSLCVISSEHHQWSLSIITLPNLKPAVENRLKFAFILQRRGFFD